MKKAIKIISAALLVLFISAFALNNMTQKGYGIGDLADDFSLKNIDNSMVSLADYKDAKGFIVTFTCNTCPFAVLYEDRIQALNEKYGSQGYPALCQEPRCSVGNWCTINRWGEYSVSLECEAIKWWCDKWCEYPMEEQETESSNVEDLDRRTQWN